MLVLELNDLVKVIEEEFGVIVVVLVVVVGVVGGGDVVVEKIEFDVELILVGFLKIKVVKVVKEVIGLGLKDVKELVDGVFKVIKEVMFKEDVEKFKE